MWLLAHTCSYTLDPAELVIKELMEPAPVEEFANIEITEGKP
jgi:hypothetical protein